METKPKDKRKVLLFLPILFLPLWVLAFYAMGGGRGGAANGPETVPKGINADLPDASFKTAEPQDKMDFYRQHDIRREQQEENGIKNVTDRLGFNIAKEDPQVEAINERLEALDREISRPLEETAYQHQTVPETVSTGPGIEDDVDRLEALMEGILEIKPEDPEIDQLTAMLDKIIAIQHPQALAENPAGPPAENDSLFRAVPAVLTDNQKAVQGATIGLCLQDSVWLQGYLIPKGHLIFGTCRIINQRLLLDIENIRMGTSIIPVDLSVYSLDGMRGINAPEAMLADAARNGTVDAARGIGLYGVDRTLATQVADAGIDAAKSLLGKKMKRVKVKLKAGYPVLLRKNNP